MRNLYQSLFLRKPDSVIANSIAVYDGNFALPEAAALEYEHQAQVNLKTDPASALRAARQAVALVPKGFDANLAFGDALAATGNPAAARAAYAVAMHRIEEMEPTAQQHWRPILKEKLAHIVSGE